MQQPCTMFDSAPGFITWTYPETLPRIPFFLVYHPCSCGREVKVEAVTYQSYFERGIQALQLNSETNEIANRALADHLSQNYWYPPRSNPTYVDDLHEINEFTDHHGRDDSDRRTNHSLPRNWLVYPEYEPDNEDSNNHRGSTIKTGNDCLIGPDSEIYDDESDEAER